MQRDHPTRRKRKYRATRLELCSPHRRAVERKINWTQSSCPKLTAPFLFLLDPYGRRFADLDKAARLFMVSMCNKSVGLCSRVIVIVIIRPLFNPGSPNVARISVTTQSTVTPYMTLPATSGRHLSKFAKRPKIPPPTTLGRILMARRFASCFCLSPCSRLVAI